jgi:hypothetical protein
MLYLIIMPNEHWNTQFILSEKIKLFFFKKIRGDCSCDGVIGRFSGSQRCEGNLGATDMRNQTARPKIVTGSKFYSGRSCKVNAWYRYGHRTKSRYFVANSSLHEIQFNFINNFNSSD